HVRFGDGLLEWIKINNYEIDGFETLVTRLFFMAGIPPLIEQTAMDARMQSFYTSFQHFRKTGKVGNLPHRYLFFSQQFRRSTGGNNIDALFFESARKFGDAGFLGNGNKGAG